MAVRREEIVRGNLEHLLDDLTHAGGVAARASATVGLDRGGLLACIEAAFASRLVDFTARELKNRGEGYYTIGSAGHEPNAVLGRLLRLDDPCLLHYRSGALMAARLAKANGETYLSDVLHSLVASTKDPVSGGRHKVWGSRRLWVPPQTSTIASHLPKAVGIGFAIARAARLGIDDALPDDAIVMVSFGDASVNHASATTAINGACWAAHQHIPIPVLFVCEDNGLGISVRTPRTWIRSAIGGREDLDYYEADGGDLAEAWTVARQAIDRCRKTRRPAFLHLSVVRLLGHAGSDVETSYHDARQIEKNEAKDPLLRWLRFAVESGLASGAELRHAYDRIEARIRRIVPRVLATPRIESAALVMRDLAFPRWSVIGAAATALADAPTRARMWGGDDRLPERDRPRHMAMQLSRALADAMLTRPSMVVFGEDVAKKGGVYHVTAGLFEKFGVGRVFNTLLDETVILGLAIGAAQIGLLPVPEIQYLAYLHNAEDQLRGEACSQRFFSRGQWDNPMVVRIASFGYQKGFGGHFHNDDSIGVLRDIPGLVIAVPSRGDDAVGMLRTCLAAATETRSVCAFLEPIALYMTKDLYVKGDGAWSFPYLPPGHAVEIGRARHYEPPSDAKRGARILVVTYANGVPMALRARRNCAVQGVDAQIHVMDLRWLAPLPVDDFLARAAESDAVLVLDECRRTGGGVAEALLAALAEDRRTAGVLCERVTALDSYVPLGNAANLVLPSEEQVVASLTRLAETMVER